MSNEAKVGVLVLIVLAILVTTFLYVANVQLTGEKIQYRTYFKYVGGLDSGSLVRYGGRKAGIITSVGPWAEDMTRTEVVFELRADVPLNEKSAATIASLNALGQNYLELTPGSIDAARIQSGGEVQAVEALTFNDLTNKVAEVADRAVMLMGGMEEKLDLVVTDIQKLMPNLQDLTGDENKQNIAGLLENSNRLLDEQTPKIDIITTQISETLTSLNEMAIQFKETTQNADQTLLSLNKTIDETREPIQENLVQLENTLEEVRLALNDARVVLVLNEDNITRIIENFRMASENLEEFSTQIKQRPWSLLRVSPKPERQVPLPGASTQ